MTITKRTLWPVFWALSATFVSAAPQELALVIRGGEGHQLGTIVSGMPDMNGDGVPDLVAGARTIGTGRGGYGVLLSGADGSVLQGPHYGPKGETFGPGASRAGDFNGDGTEDYMVGNTLWDFPVWFSGEIRVYSGKDGSLIAKLPALHVTQDRLGHRQLPLGDINGDGFDDVIASPLQDDYVAIYGGPDGHVIRKHDPGNSTFAHLARLGDLNGDGVTEYAIGSSTWWAPENDAGKVDVFDGRSGSVLYRVAGLHKWSFLGPVAPLSDIDGDGIPDWVAGEPGIDGLTSPFCSDGLTNGRLRIFSGVDGHELRRIPAPTSLKEAFGWRLHGGGDLNGDGYWDLLVSSPCNLRRLRVYSGRTWAHLWTIRQDEVKHLGFEINNLRLKGFNILGDLNGDGCAEWGVGADNLPDSGLSNGALFIFAGAPGDAEIVCVTSPNSVGAGARFSTFGSIGIGDDELVLRVDDAPPRQQGQFFYGPALASTPYGDGILCIDGGNLGIQPLGQPTTIDLDGHAEFKVPFDALAAGPGAWTPGSTWVVQFIYRDPAGPGGSGINSSDALLVTLNP
jgi:VCBS repeat protein